MSPHMHGPISFSGIHRMHVSLPSRGCFTLLACTTCSECRGDDLDTRLLRAMVIKGILEKITTNTVNLVNADLLAKTRGLRIIESTVPAEGRSVFCAAMRNTYADASHDNGHSIIIKHDNNNVNNTRIQQ